ncbi:MAG TPA: response regulator [Kofleriaceae bacterium]|nr:response regulator [Kofleriaceae bacterium]
MTRAVLVVDDSPMSRRLVIKNLPPGLGDDVTQAENGLEALAALRARPHAVVLLDLNMPVMDGYQFLEALRGTELPVVIVLSGDVQPRAHERVLALGARAFVKKPIRAETLARVLGDCGLT